MTFCIIIQATCKFCLQTIYVSPTSASRCYLDIIMLTNIAKFTVRTYGEILKKFRYVADYNGRSANRELEVLMKKHIAEFEKEHGKITFD